MNKHLAIMSRAVIEAILSGQKTVETRFSLHRIPPFGAASMGDLVFMKPPGEDIIGQFRVKKVFYFEGLTRDDMDKIWQDYQKDLAWDHEEKNMGAKDYWQKKIDCKFGTLIFITQSERLITSPIKIKKKDQRGWVILEKGINL